MLYEILHLPFGLWNAAQSFQRFMNQVLQGLNSVFCYIDDMLIVSPSLVEHKQYLQDVFERFENKN